MGFGMIRRSQLIAPFGVGSMLVTRSGISVMCCSLDKWYQREPGGKGEIDEKEFIVREWRLERELKVDHFRLPPDYRPTGLVSGTSSQPNMKLTVPFLRFPKFHYCSRCGYLTELPLSYAERRVYCPSCKKKNKKRLLVQVPIIAICEHGHIQDFPWREWVHKSSNPQCEKQMYLKGTGGASLASLVVKCECGAERNLAQVTTADSSTGETYLSAHLEPAGRYLCQGKRPWMHDDEGVGCGKPLRGSLRSASNVYFASVKSSIYLPRADARVEELLQILQGVRVSVVINQLVRGSHTEVLTPAFLREFLGYELADYSDAQIETALKYIINGSSEEKTKREVIDHDPEVAFRREEFEVLTQKWDDNQLKVEPQDLSKYGKEVAGYFSNISLVEKLRETRVLTGFTRVLPENDLTLEQKMNLLWLKKPDPKWLPAYVVHGEGIFFGFDESRLSEWENREDVQARIRPLITNLEKRAVSRGYIFKEITPRFVLLHTFAHVLINRLTFECGYSTASLRERLYVSNNPDAPMAGVLIYTAAGDSEGTMGGLVRMGKPKYLEPVLRRALEGAKWCSADPVCMEMGDSGGQGPDSCNLAACHSCALVPETACEEFNRFLDRALLVGSLANPDLGFFAGLFK